MITLNEFFSLCCTGDSFKLSELNNYNTSGVLECFDAWQYMKNNGLDNATVEVVVHTDDYILLIYTLH